MKKTRERFKFIVEKTRTGFSAYSEDLPVYTIGRTFTDLNSNIPEAINFYFEEEDVMILSEDILPICA